MDRVGAEGARLDEFLDLGDGDPARHGGQRVEVVGGLVEDQVAVGVAAPRVDEGVVGGDAVFEDVVATGEGAGLLRRRGDGDAAVCRVVPGQTAVGDLCAHARRGVEGRDAGAAGSQPLGEGALRDELDLQFTAEVLAGELLVLPT